MHVFPFITTKIVIFLTFIVNFLTKILSVQIAVVGVFLATVAKWAHAATLLFFSLCTRVKSIISPCGFGALSSFSLPAYCSRTHAHRHIHLHTDASNAQWVLDFFPIMAEKADFFSLCSVKGLCNYSEAGLPCRYCWGARNNWTQRGRERVVYG